jgi:hypothetical protein
MMQHLPILDKKPTGRPHDWNHRKLLQLKAAAPVSIPEEWENPNAVLVAQRDQQDRGTCVGQSGAYCADMLHLQLTSDRHTDADHATFKLDVVDEKGTLHDVLFEWSASAECFYDISRQIGGFTDADGEGSETRFAAAGWINYGYVPETLWHTAKTPRNIWSEPPGAKEFAAKHRAEGWAMLGDDYGIATFQEVKEAIYKYGFVIAGIPVYSNYGKMANGNGMFPEPGGYISGYHALCLYGYTKDKIKLLHSWGNWCSMFGGFSENYFNTSATESVYLVVLDSTDVAIARENYVSLTVTSKDKVTKDSIKAKIYVDGVAVGFSPQKFAVERGKKYKLEAQIEGYRTIRRTYTVTAKKKLSLTLSLSMVIS